MNDRRNSGYGTAIMLIVVGLVLCIGVLGVLLYSQSLTDGAPIQRLSANATAIAAVMGIFAFMILVKYTFETRLLRKASEEQLEGKIKPVVVLEIASGDFVVGELRPRIKTHQFNNIGMGPAFNVSVEPIVGNANIALCIESVPLIKSNGAPPAVYFAVENNHSSVLARSDSDLGSSFLDDLFTKGRFPDRTPVKVSCTGLSGKRYRFLHLIRYDLDTGRIWMEFDRMDTSGN
jgi:hypothetical protein